MLWVITFHSVSNFCFNAPVIGQMLISKWWPICVAMNGDAGVDLFLVLSGFLLGGSLFKQFSKTGTIGYCSFYAKRWFRIAPALVLATVLGIITDLPAGSWQGCVVDGHWWTNLVFINNYFPEWNSWLPMCMIHTWSVAVEVQLYCITPPLFALAWFLSQKLSKLSFATWAVVVIGIAWSACVLVRIVYAVQHRDDMIAQNRFALPYVWTQYRSCSYFSGLVAGIAVQQHTDGKLGVGSPALQWLILFISALIAFFAVLLGGEPMYFAQTQMEGWVQHPVFLLVMTAICRPLIGLASSYLLALATTGHAPRLSGFLSLRCWTPLAGMSYSMYLLQYVGWGILLLPVSNATFGKLSESSLLLGIAVAWAQPLMALVATLPLALLSYVLVERTGILLGQRAIKACSTDKSVPAEEPDIEQAAGGLQGPSPALDACAETDQPADVDKEDSISSDCSTDTGGCSD
jgi:peptidoglycan/LPS O-acetylase OafA/YrhL